MWRGGKGGGISAFAAELPAYTNERSLLSMCIPMTDPREADNQAELGYNPSSEPSSEPPYPESLSDGGLEL
jgi:hypothetical protein